MWPILFHLPRHWGGLSLLGWLLLVWTGVNLVGLAMRIRREGHSREAWRQWAGAVAAGALVAWIVARSAGPDGLPIHAYGLMLLLAIVAGTALALWRARPRGVPADTVLALVFWMVVPGIVGARLFFVIQYWGIFRRETFLATLGAMADLGSGGLVVYGSLIGAVVGFVGYALARRLPILTHADLLAPSLMLGLALGRVGCLLNGCCFGGVCHDAWAVTFPFGSPPHVQQVLAGQLDAHGLRLPLSPHTVPRIEAVAPDSPAARAGVRAGTLIVSIDGEPVRSTEEAQFHLLRARAPGEEIVLTFYGDTAAARWRIERPLPRSLPVHPTQLYSALNAGILCLLLLAYAPYRRHEGQVAALMLTLYPLTRFLLEAIRTDEPGVLGTSLSIAQVVSLALLALVPGFWALTVWRGARAS